MTGSAQGTNGRSEPRPERGRFSSRRKTEAVLRLLRGEELDGPSRELSATAATLARWRERFLAAGQVALKSRPADDRDEEIHRLQAKVGGSLTRFPGHLGLRRRCRPGRGPGCPEPTHPSSAVVLSNWPGCGRNRSRGSLRTWGSPGRACTAGCGRPMSTRATERA